MSVRVTADLIPRSVLDWLVGLAGFERGIGWQLEQRHGTAAGSDLDRAKLLNERIDRSDVVGVDVGEKDAPDRFASGRGGCQDCVFAFWKVGVDEREAVRFGYEGSS